ncbi:hypothetical protein M527_03960 [Sphingobium indicum IP26]|nr:hypothetical protein M527_03960 [Sphingobium indicum IP26]
MDEQMARLEPYFPKRHGKPRLDERRNHSEIMFACLKRLATGRDALRSMP